MITLQLLEPCENCPKFTPVKTNEFDTFHEFEVEHHATVTCKNIGICSELLEYLKKEAKKNGK